jgi:hypothetical protein
LLIQVPVTCRLDDAQNRSRPPVHAEGTLPFADNQHPSQRAVLYDELMVDGRQGVPTDQDDERGLPQVWSSPHGSPK